MAKCKNCETEEIGYGTILDKRGYCYKPSCQSCSYDEVEQQNTRLQSELDKTIKQLKDYEKTLKEYAESDNWDLKTLQIEKIKYGWRPALKTLKKWGK